MTRDYLAIPLRAAVVGWILAPVLATAFAQDDAADPPAEDEAPADDEAPAEGEAPAHGEQPAPGFMMGGMDSMGHTPGMTDNPKIQEIREAHGGDTPGHQPKPTSGRTDLTAARDTLFRVLSKRGMQPECKETDGMADDPVADYVWLVDHIAMPPWVPLRATDCLISGYAGEPPAGAAMLRWITDPKSQGAAMLVLDRIDDLPEDLAVNIAKKAVNEGPDPKEAKKRVKASERDSVRNAWK